MKIQKLTITDEELKEAVGQWLTTKGISLPVSDVSRQYTWETEYTVSFIEEEKVRPPKDEPKPESKEYVSPAIEALDREAKMHEADATETPL